MTLSSWVSRRLFSIFDSDKIFEEMDRMVLEEKILDFQEEQEYVTWKLQYVLPPTAITVIGIALGPSLPLTSGDGWRIPIITTGLIMIAGGAIAVGYWWCKNRLRAIRKFIVQLEITKVALRKRRQVYFSISMRMPRHRHPLILRACRLAVTAIENLAEQTKALNDGASWQDLYTDEIRGITSRSAANSEFLSIEEVKDKNDDDQVNFEEIFDALIAVFKLHASEYCRVVVSSFLGSLQFDSRKLLTLFKACGHLHELTEKLATIEKLALKLENEIMKNANSRKKIREHCVFGMDVGWKQQTAIALEAILERLESEDVNQSEIEVALRKTLIVVGSKIVAENTEPSQKIDLKSETKESETTEISLIKGGNTERTNVDMVFEGVCLSETDKIAASRSETARDVFLDGLENRRHELSVLGELEMVLEPRRTSFAKRERAALAKFYGIEENLLEKEENFENEKKRIEGEGIGIDGINEQETYDWRKDAEDSAGIHHDADNADFLTALILRRVEDDILE